MTHKLAHDYSYARLGGARPAEAQQSVFTACVGLQLRPCRENDLRALEWMGLYARHRDIIHDTFRQQQAGTALMLLAVSSGFPLAQAWLDFGHRGTVRRPMLWAVRVFPPLQAYGIGTWIISAAETAASERGALDIQLGVEPENTLALRFYERLGYRAVGNLEIEFNPGRSDSAAAATLQLMEKQLLRC
jgi:ribosomal protein S18 acetylase RimI-like enzyme